MAGKAQRKRGRARSIPCALCRKPVTGPQDGHGFRAGPLRFATCLECAPQVREGAQTLGRVARKMVEGRYPRVGLALKMLEGALEAPLREDKDQGR